MGIRDVALLAVGDISLVSSDGENPFRNILPHLGRKDILFGNLETTLTEAETKDKKAAVLKAPPVKATFLADAGFDIMNLANNHSLDYGVQGLDRTAQLLESLGIQVVGVKTHSRDRLFTVIKRNGVRVGFLSFVTGIFGVPDDTRMNSWKRKETLDRVNSHRQLCDVLVVSLHWGVENVVYPSPGQVETARSIIDAGADIVLGHGPHVIQAVEKYKGGCIAYSLGNFNFDNRLSYTKSNQSMIVRFFTRDSGGVDFSIVPVTIGPDSRPIEASDFSAAEIRRFLSESATKIADGKIDSDWWYNQVASTYLSNSVTSYRKRLGCNAVATALEIAVWLATPFTLRCFLTVVLSKIEGERS